MSRSVLVIIGAAVVVLLLIIACVATLQWIGGDTTAPTSVPQPIAPSPLLNIAPQPTTYTAAGQVINYSYVVSNNGTTSLTGNVTITDNKVTGVTCPNTDTVGNNNGNFDVGEKITCTGTYTTTQADVDNTTMTNTATATVGGQTSPQATATINVPLNPVLRLDVIASPNAINPAQVGQNITFQYTITNTGATTLGPAQFVVRDDRIPSPINCGPNNTTLATNQSVSCNTVYTTTQADVAACQVVSTANATGAGAKAIQPAVTTVSCGTAGPILAPITPGSNVTHVVTPGDWLLQISRCYGASFVAVRTANPQITNPNVIYPQNIVRVPNAGSVGTPYGPPCMIWYTVVSGDSWQSIADKNNASVEIMRAANPTVSTLTAGVKIKVPVNSKGGAPVTPSTPIPIPTTPVPLILRLAVTATPATFTAAGQNITINYTITNGGTTTLGPAQFIIRDSLFPNPINCGANNSTLAPNQTVVCNGVYVTTQTDVTAGQAVSNATASGGNAVTSQQTVTAIRYAPVVPTVPTVRPPIRLSFTGTNPATATQSGTIGTPDTIRYVFTGTAGQVLNVRLTVPTNDVGLGIYAPNGTTLKQLDTTTTWSGTLTVNGDYNIDLVSSVGSPSKMYTLDVTLTTPGPPSPTEMVADIFQGGGSSNPSYLSAFNGQLYFQANGNNGAGPEFWRYDRGTNAASMVNDIYLGATGSEPAYLRPYTSMLYFSANGNDNAGTELWRFNGSAVGRVNDLFVGPEGSSPKYMTEFNGSLYFSANGNNGSGVELWRFDGNTSVSTMAADINPGPGNSNPSYLAVFNNALYFAATTTNGGTELWKFDGTTATLASDITTGAGNANPAFLAVYNNVLYFSANGNNGAGTELWKYDGTTSSMASDINPGPTDSAPTYMTVFNNALYFGANGNSSGFELWKFDGTTASMAADINPAGSSSPAYLAVYNNELYFQAESNNGAGKELWRFKGP